MTMEMLQQFAGVAVVMGMLAAAVWWLRRRGLAYLPVVPMRRKTGLLQNVERLPLSPHHTLHLVRMEGRVLLIAVSPSGCQMLDSSPWKES
jgi:flagellar biogenesis protein FliO